MKHVILIKTEKSYLDERVKNAALARISLYDTLDNGGDNLAGYWKASDELRQINRITKKQKVSITDEVVMEKIAQFVRTTPNINIIETNMIQRDDGINVFHEVEIHYV